MEMLLIFANQFLVIFLLGMQSLMVRDNNYIGAAVGSFLIGITQFYVFSSIAEIGREGAWSTVWWGFILAGPLAIMFSMYIHPHINKHVFRRSHNDNRTNG